MITARHPFDRERSQRGATVVEFAVILPILLVILFGILEFGFLFLQSHFVANAAREGVRIGIRSQNYNCFDTLDSSSQCSGATVKVYRKDAVLAALTDCTANPKGYLCTLYQQEIVSGSGALSVVIATDDSAPQRKLLTVTVTAPNFFPRLVSRLVPGYDYPRRFVYKSSGDYEDATEP